MTKTRQKQKTNTNDETTEAKKPSAKASKKKKVTPVQQRQDIELQAILIPELSVRPVGVAEESVIKEPSVQSVAEEPSVQPVAPTEEVAATKPEIKAKPETKPDSDMIIEETTPGSMSILVESIVTFNNLCDLLAAQTCNINAIAIDGIRQSMFISYDILKINQAFLIDLFTGLGTISSRKTGNTD
ncbi:hypothetical protein MBAV_004946 [Candidatus Magnetobacterium bavaricum]|uniref:Uncharacterized protein n=1 Tax=Candidatus Magnetobacterium bavaricum TaxID=29290 RepID=A0A0F3GLS5_9BACT|nr:hypothetical protein MBAV_004946 [Candidatus Magnetobacterium bavaricum]